MNPLTAIAFEFDQAEPARIPITEMIAADTRTATPRIGKAFGSTSIALDLVVSGLPANLPPEQLQQLRVLVPEVKRQLVAELDDEIRKTLRQGLLLKVNFMSDRGAALFGFNISGNDL